jgi:RimJ/RimL family protein N-acetyltransferase
MSTAAPDSPGIVTLREVTPDDLPIFFQHRLDPEASYMAAFTAKDPPSREAFDEHWAKILADPAITNRAILLDGQTVGNIACFPYEGEPNIGYGIDRQYWGRGIATRALTQFLEIVTTRPIFAAAAADNLGSIRVLEKCGFTQTALIKGYADARETEIDEALFKLE